MRKLPPLLLLAAATLLSTASASATETDEQIWIAPIVQGPLVGKARFWFEGQVRLAEDASKLVTTIVRPAIQYPLGHGFAVWLGYAWTPSHRPKYADEHRPWQQINHVYESRGAQLQNRFRFEERFLETGLVFRPRYMARFVYRPKSWNGFGFAVWDEMFFHLNEKEKGPRAGIDQNRFGIGPQWQPIKQLILEPSYVAQTIYREGRPEKLGHTFLLFVWITL